MPPERPRRAADAVVGRTISSCACEPGVGRELEAVADLDALDGLDAHQRAGEPGVEPAVPVHVRAEARAAGRGPRPRRRRRACRRPCGPGRSRRPSLRGVGVEAADRVGVEVARGRRGRAATPAGARDAAELDDVARPSRRRAPARGRRWPPRRARPGRRSRGRWPARGSAGPRRSRTSACRPGRRGPGAGGSAARCGPAPSSSTGSTGSADITCLPLGPLGVADLDRRRAALGQRRAGRRRVIVTSSCSNFIRAPRP